MNIIKAQLLLFLSFMAITAFAQNYDESDVPDYELPTILDPNQTVVTWEKERRGKFLQLFEENVYGRTPAERLEVEQTVRVQPFVIGNLQAIQKEIRLQFFNATRTDSMDLELLLILPAGAKSPIFLGLNSYGNHTVHSSPTITIHDKWTKNSTEYNLFDHQATAASRGVHSNRWPIERLLSRGYGLATFYYGDVFLDRQDGAVTSIQRLFEEQTNWNAIGAWSWGLSRAMDYLVTDKQVDGSRVAVVGHSRRGKATLWAGAQDERFAAIISNESGCGGAALSLRQYGERLSNINRSFPHWFCDTFKSYNDKEDQLPVDQHQLLALIAPRLLYVASAQQDRWADPRGEYLAAKAASEAYRLYELNGLQFTTFPDANQPLHDAAIGYHLRYGKHDLSRYDWEQFMDFLAHHWK
ncbi:MAG: acetylxylan esterase [Bacteroidota bacterium]